MKYLLLLSVLFLSTCSADSVEEQTIEEPELFSIFIMDECPNGVGDDYWVIMYQEAFENYLEYVRNESRDCVFLTVADRNGETYPGYWGGFQTPEDYELPPLD